MGRQQSFTYVRKQLGLQDATELSLGSPFDFKTNVTLYIPTDMPIPQDQHNYESALADYIRYHVMASQGQAFVLFTSTTLMHHIHKQVQHPFEVAGYKVLCQNQNLTRQQMITEFIQHGNAVLFGVDSFWQGIDIVGQALSNVIITRLPFPVPSHPLIEAKSEHITEEGGNAFFDFSVPEAILKLKQGIGRLIRSQQDSGRIVILDSRLLRKSYGRIFIDSLPECTIIDSPKSAHPF